MTTARSSAFRSALAASLVAGLLIGPAPATADSEDVGNVLRVGIPAAAFALTVKRDDRDGRRQFYRAFGSTMLATVVLKEGFDKKRPDGTGDDAFPSGHAATAFQGAAFIHRRYGIRDAWLAYTLAAVTAWTRVDSDEHDTADVLGGAAVGMAASLILTKRRGVELTASASGDGIAIHIGGRVR